MKSNNNNSLSIYIEESIFNLFLKNVNFQSNKTSNKIHLKQSLKINKKIFNILILVLFASFVHITENLNIKNHKKHFCGIELLKTPKRILIPEEDFNNKSFKTIKRLNVNELTNTESKWEPIRIHFDFSFIEENLNLKLIKEKNLIDLKETIIPKAKQVLESLLNVKRIRNKLKLNSPHCETFPIPSIYNHGGTGVEADLIIFVSIDTSGYFNENGVEAAAIHCLQNSETRRPIAGHINFKPDLNIKYQHEIEYYAWLAIHEISHILVFNRELYDDYINPETNEPLGYDRVIGSKIFENGKKINYIKTSRVLEKSKKHFNCKNIQGIPLEYNGGAGTAGSHWSRRYMNSDYMIGESFGENLISDITLALFEDSGWYKVNQNNANLFVWGKDKGCDFLDRGKKCIFAEQKEDFNKFVNEMLFEFVKITKNNSLVNNQQFEKYTKSDVVNLQKENDLSHIILDNSNNQIVKNNNTKERLLISVEKRKAKKNIDAKKFKNENKLKFSFTKENIEGNDMYNKSKNEDENYIFNFIINNTLKINNGNNRTRKYYLEYKTDFKNEFCTNFNMPVCSTSNIFRGSCLIEEITEPLELYEKLFKVKNIGGYEKLADRCPTPIESRYKQSTYGGSCRNGEKFSSTKSFEKICPECACFMSNLREINPKNNTLINNKVKLFRKNNIFMKSISLDKKKIYDELDLSFSNEFFEDNDVKPFLNNLEKKKYLKNIIENKKINNSLTYEKIQNFFKKPEERIEYSFKQKNGTFLNKSKLLKNEINNEKIENEEYIEEYEFIKLNPILREDDYIASCFQFKCEKEELYVVLNDDKYKCEENELTNIPGYFGGIRCPSKNILCAENYLCKFGCFEKFNNSIITEKYNN